MPVIRDIVERFQDRHPGVQLTHRDLNPVDPLTPLRSGEIDVAHLWLPVREPDIVVGPITHTSAVVPAMSTEEAFRPFRTPSGRLVTRGPVVATWDDQLKAIAAGQAVIACPAETARFYSGPGAPIVLRRFGTGISASFPSLREGTCLSDRSSTRSRLSSRSTEPCAKR
jgi:DNA-binding transcriptional LysR family regulator